jgi:hypothetical protein
MPKCAIYLIHPMFQAATFRLFNEDKANKFHAFGLIERLDLFRPLTPPAPPPSSNHFFRGGGGKLAFCVRNGGPQQPICFVYHFEMSTTVACQPLNAFCVLNKYLRLGPSRGRRGRTDARKPQTEIFVSVFISNRINKILFVKLLLVVVNCSHCCNIIIITIIIIIIIWRLFSSVLRCPGFPCEASEAAQDTCSPERRNGFSGPLNCQEQDQYIPFLLISLNK